MRGACGRLGSGCARMRRAQPAHTGAIVCKQGSHLFVQQDIARVKSRVGHTLSVQERQAVGYGARKVVRLGDQTEPERERLLCELENSLQADLAVWREERILARAVGRKPKGRKHVRVPSLGR